MHDPPMAITAADPLRDLCEQFADEMGAAALGSDKALRSVLLDVTA